MWTLTSKWWNLIGSDCESLLSVKCEVWSVKCELWSVNCELWSVKCELWTVNCELWTVKCEVWSVKCEVWSVKCEVWSVNCELWSVKCEVWTVNCELWTVNCELWTVNCELWTVNKNYYDGGSAAMQLQRVIYVCSNLHASYVPGTRYKYPGGSGTIAFGTILLSFSWLFLFLYWGKTPPQISFSNFLRSFFFKFLFPIFSKFLLSSSILSNLLIAVNFFLQFSYFFSLPTLAWRLVLLRRTRQTVLVHGSQRHPRYRRRFWDTTCEPYKSLKTISGCAKPSSNFFLQFSLNFSKFLQSSPIYLLL